jgi:N-acetylmuramoyl-L-alanine amidase
MNREINFIVVHCTATQPEAKIADIKRYWKEVLGWKTPGYHYIIDRNGDVTKLVSESVVANGVKNHNSHSIHLSYIGGIDRKGKPFDNRTKAQEAAMFDLIVDLSERYPNAKILGHRDFVGVVKACPSFDVKEWLKNFTPNLKFNFVA